MTARAETMSAPVLEALDYRGKRALVAGGTGTIGIPLVRQLLERGAHVTVSSLDSERYASSVLPETAVFVRRDFMDERACMDAVEGADFVFNLVGIKGSVGIGQSRVASYLVPMLKFQTNLMEAAFHHRVSRFLFVGSINEYPPSAEPKQEDEVGRGIPAQNDRIPGMAKRIGEVQGEAYLLEHGWDAVRVVRPSNVYGPYDDFNPATAQVIPALIRRVADGENPLKVWGDGSAIRDFIYSEDAAYWMLEALSKAPPSIPVNLSGCERVSIRQLAETIAGFAKVKTAIQWDASGPTGDPVRVLSTQRAKQYLGYELRTPIGEGLRRTYDWFVGNRELALTRGH